MQFIAQDYTKKLRKGIYKSILTCYNNVEYKKKGANEMAYILEKSNSKHNGRIFMRDGESVKDIMPLVDFISNCNAAGDLIDPEYPFLSFISNAFPTKDSLNHYLNVLKRFNNQLGDMVLQMKRKGALVQVPDAEYWNKRFETISDKIDTGKTTKIAGSKELAQEFLDVVNTCIAENEKEAKRYEIAIPSRESTKNK